MSRQSTFNHYKLTFEKKKKVLEIAKFLGVDYNPAQLQVSKDHATDILNIIYKDRVNQKRKGWEQIAKVTNVIYYVKIGNQYFMKRNTTNFNGFYYLIGKDGLIYYIAHIGKILFQVTNIGIGHNFIDVQFKPLTKRIAARDVAVELEDYKSSAFLGDKKLYILGGNKLFTLTANNGVFTLDEVEDSEDTYVPVTTIGITYKDSPVSGMTALDDVNLMTQWRRNKLVSGTYIDDGVSVRTTRFWDYELDTNVHCKNATDINNIKIKINSLEDN